MQYFMELVIPYTFIYVFRRHIAKMAALLDFGIMLVTRISDFNLSKSHDLHNVIKDI
jgi:hypothetical protein